MVIYHYNFLRNKYVKGLNIYISLFSGNGILYVLKENG